MLSSEASLRDCVRDHLRARARGFIDASVTKRDAIVSGFSTLCLIWRPRRSSRGGTRPSVKARRSGEKSTIKERVDYVLGGQIGIPEPDNRHVARRVAAPDYQHVLATPKRPPSIDGWSLIVRCLTYADKVCFRRASGPETRKSSSRRCSGR